MSVGIIIHLICRSDLRIATETTRSRKWSSLSSNLCVVAFVLFSLLQIECFFQIRIIVSNGFSLQAFCSCKYRKLNGLLGKFLCFGFPKYTPLSPASRGRRLLNHRCQFTDFLNVSNPLQSYRGAMFIEM